MPVPPQPRRRAATGALTKKQLTMERLVDAAEELISRQGYAHTTVSEIAAAAGVVPSVINAYFLGKDGLLYAVARRYNARQFEATRIAAATPGTAAERLSAVIAEWARLDFMEPRLYAALCSLSWSWPADTEADYRSDLEPFWDVVMAMFEAGVAAGEFRPLPRVDLTELLLGVYQWGMRPAIFEHQTPAACADRVTRLVLMALEPRRPGG